MSLLVLLHLLMFVSVHACNARSVGVLDKFQDLKKESSVTSVVAQVGHDDKSKFESGGATTIIHKDLETFLSHGKHTIAFSGIKSIVNSQIDMQQEVQLIQEMKRQGRSLGESKTTDEEAIHSNQNEIVEDVVVMDYASPHRKPPIHNEKP